MGHQFVCKTCGYRGKTYEHRYDAMLDGDAHQMNTRGHEYKIVETLFGENPWVQKQPAVCRICKMRGYDLTKGVCSVCGAFEEGYSQLNPKMSKRKGTAYLGDKPMKQSVTDAKTIEENLIVFGPLGPQASWFGFDENTYLVYMLIDPSKREEFINKAQTIGKWPIFPMRKPIGAPGTIEMFWSNPLTRMLVGALQLIVHDDELIATHLAVKEKWRRQGVGTGIMNYAQVRWPGRKLLLHDLTTEGRGFMGGYGGEEYGVSGAKAKAETETNPSKAGEVRRLKSVALKSKIARDYDRYHFYEDLAEQVQKMTAKEFKFYLERLMEENPRVYRDKKTGKKYALVWQDAEGRECCVGCGIILGMGVYPALHWRAAHPDIPMPEGR